MEAFLEGCGAKVLQPVSFVLRPVRVGLRNVRGML